MAEARGKLNELHVVTHTQVHTHTHTTRKTLGARLSLHMTKSVTCGRFLCEIGGSTKADTESKGVCF